MIIKTLEPLSEINLKKIEDATGIKPEYVSRENISDETLGCADVIITRDRDFKSEVLEKCHNLKFLFVVSAGALVGIGYAILMLVHRFYKPSAVTGDIQEFINEETESTFLQDSEKKERDSLLSMLFNPNTTIRKKFKKQIQQGSHLNKKAGNFITVSLTPLELEQYAKLPDDERTHLLHALYEKARYSKEGCTKDDVASFKKS